MGFFDDVATNIANAANKIGDKAENLYDVSRLTYNANSIKGEINKKLAEFGSAVYQGAKKEDFKLSSLESQIQEIDALYLQLNSVNDLITKAKTNTKFCPNCGQAVDKDSVFCTNCGEKIS